MLRCNRYCFEIAAVARIQPSCVTAPESSIRRYKREIPATNMTIPMATPVSHSASAKRGRNGVCVVAAGSEVATISGGPGAETDDVAEDFTFHAGNGTTR